MRLGIEVSNNNGLLDWPLIGASGISVACVKVSEGGAFHDDFAYRNLRGARAAGIEVGAYIFGRPSAGTGLQDAQFGWKVAQTCGYFDWFALDVEDTRVAPLADLGAYTLDALETLESYGVGRVRLYTSHGYARDHQLDHLTALNRYDLWLASWQVAEPMSFPPFGAWAGWQFTAEGFLPGAGLVSMSLWR